MNKTLKRVLGIVLALAVVAGCGFFARDAKLKATEEEILPEEGTTAEAPAEEKVEEKTEEVLVEENEDYTVSVIGPVGEGEEEAEPVEGEEDPEGEGSEAEEPADEEEKEEEPEEEAAKAVRLWYEYEGELHFGIEITIRSELDESYGENVTYQWMYSTDNKNWLPVKNATESSYKFILDETNNWYYWDLIVTEAE